MAYEEELKEALTKVSQQNKELKNNNCEASTSQQKLSLNMQITNRNRLRR